MGHARLTNLSNIFVRRLFAKGKVTIREVADVCLAKGETLHASEGEYEERHMVCFGLEDVVDFLLKKHKYTPHGEPTPVIEPVDMTEEQQKIYEQWIDGDTTEWDCGNDGEGGEYGILDSIHFRFAPGWRKRYPDIPILEHITH